LIVVRRDVTYATLAVLACGIRLAISAAGRAG
jgi:hypothetical protein